MPKRRILSLWFPYLAAERILRQSPDLQDRPLAVVAQSGGAQHVASLSPAAQAKGLRRNMGLSDARALYPDLITRVAHPMREALFLAALRRWAGQFSPWVSEEGPEALFLDISGCAHLFGGEAELTQQMADGLMDMGLTHRVGIADTAGAAWAVARFGGEQSLETGRSGDAIDQEARATRSRAAKRGKWARVPLSDAPFKAPIIIPPGEIRRHLEPFPVAALRLEQGVVESLQRLGLHTVGALSGLPRGTVARRFGLEVTRRLDQALGAVPEPISPARAQSNYATRMSFPDPIGLAEDIEAALHRVLTPLCDKLGTARRGVRRLQLTCFRADATHQVIEIGLARPSYDPAHIMPLLQLRIGEIEPGFGIDVIRLHAVVSEPLTPQQHKGHLEAAQVARERMSARVSAGGDDDFAQLMSRLAARVGLEAMTRLVPAQSHIPEKAATVMAAAYTPPVEEWPAPRSKRPVVMFRPEHVKILDEGRPPAQFVWRRRTFETLAARGPERIAPEWWLDEPEWRSGPRDYWEVTTRTGEALWLFKALGGEISGGWFVQGDFN